jgi:hypothetical protein
VKYVTAAETNFIFLHLLHCGSLKNGISLLTIRSFVTDFYKSYKIMKNNNTGSWKAAFEIATACLHMGGKEISSRIVSHVKLECT